MSSPSLRYRWTPLHTHFAGRCLQEHEKLTTDVQRAVAAAGAHSNMANNAKLRGLVQTLGSRCDVMRTFIIQHKELYGDVDGEIMDEFERVLQRMQLVYERALEGSTSTATQTRERKTITFSPSCSTPVSKSSSSTSRRSTGSMAKGAASSPAPTMCDLRNKYEELIRSVDTNNNRSTSAGDFGAPPASSSAGSTQRSNIFSSHPTPSRNIFQPSPIFGLRNEIKINTVKQSSHNNVYTPSSSTTPSSWTLSSLPSPPLGYLYDFSVERSQMRERLAIQEEECVSRGALLSAHRMLEQSIIQPDRRSLDAHGLLSDDVNREPTPLAAHCLDRLHALRSNETWWGRLTLYVSVTIAVSIVCTVVVSFLLEVDAWLETLRPYGGGVQS